MALAPGCGDEKGAGCHVPRVVLVLGWLKCLQLFLLGKTGIRHMGPSPGCQTTPGLSNPISSASLAWAGARTLGFLLGAQAAGSVSPV